MKKITQNWQLIFGLIGITFGSISFVVGASTTMDNPIKTICLYVMLVSEVLVVLSIVSHFKNN